MRDVPGELARAATLIGQAGAALPVLFAGVLDPRITRIVLDSDLSSLAALASVPRPAWNRYHYIPDALHSMDLPHLIGAIVNTKPDALPIRRAILRSRNDLLAQVVGSFLKTTEWDVIRVSSDGDIEDVIREMGRVDPEVVILRRDRAEDSSHALRLIEERPCIKVVMLGLDSNTIQVYSRQNIILRGASDLLSILENGNFSNCMPGKEALLWFPQPSR